MNRFAPCFALAFGIALTAAAWAQTAPAATPTSPAAPAPTTTPATTPAPSAVVGDHNTQLSDRIPPEQQLQLQAGDDKFAARYIADLSAEHRGAVIVLHDSGQHQSWPFTIAALLDDLPLHGWSTLAIELPAPPQDAPAAVKPAAAPAAPPASPPATPAATATTAAMITGSEAGIEKQVQARIDAAVKKLAELAGKPEATVLIGFGSGAWREVEFARKQAEGNGAKVPEPIRALVLVDPRNRIVGATADLPKLLPTTELPTFDIVQNSETQTRADAEARRRAVLHQKNRIYQQIMLPPLNASDATDATVLVRRVRSWIQHNVQPEEKKKSPAK